MFPFRRRLAFSQDETVRMAAYRTVREYENYVREIGGTLSTGALAAFLVVLVFKLVTWANSLSVEHGEQVPRIILGPMTETAAGVCFSLLIAVAIALQIAVRNGTQLDAKSLDDATSASVTREFARLRFLTEFSFMIGIAAWFIGFYVASDSVKTFETLNLSGVFGPLIGAMIAATCAADATVVSNPEFANAENMRRAWDTRKLEILENAYELTLGFSEHQERKNLRFKLAMLVLCPAAGIFVSYWIASFFLELGGGIWFALLFFVVEVAVAAAVYGVMYGTVQDYVMKRSFNMVGNCLMSGSVGLLTFLMFATYQLNTLQQGTPPQTVIFSTFWFLAILMIPIVIASKSLFGSRRSPKPGWMRQHLLDQLKVRKDALAEKLRKGAASDPPDRNPMATLAFWMSIAPPVGMILGTVVLKQTGVRRRTYKGKQVGRKRALFSISVNLVILGLLLLGPLYLATCPTEDYCLVAPEKSQTSCTQENC